MLRALALCTTMLLLLLQPATSTLAAGGPSKQVRARVEAQQWRVNRQKCLRLTKQIGRYEGVADMARGRGDSLWYDATRRQITRLENERIARCPEYEKPNPLVRFGSGTVRLMKRAASAARRYFTGGI